jgi:succinoglycan biosynthesis protein ExoM
MTSVAICIATFLRPQYLGELLHSLTELDTEGLSVRVIVVDNDTTGSAEAVTKRFVPLLPSLTYKIEPVRGISAPHNRCAEFAYREGVDYLAYIADDETVDRAWLQNLVQAALRYEADAVGGPVLPAYDPGVPDWVIEGDFFEPERFPTGTALLKVSTNNLLIKRETLQRLDGPFDLRYGLTGGEDFDLVLRLAGLGARIVWCDEAVVRDHVRLSRANAVWLVKRRARNGMVAAQRAIQRDPRLRSRLTQAGPVLLEFRRDLRRLKLALLGPQAARIHALRGCAFRIAKLAGLAGVKVEWYRKVDGR